MSGVDLAGKIALGGAGFSIPAERDDDAAVAVIRVRSAALNALDETLKRAKPASSRWRYTAIPAPTNSAGATRMAPDAP